MKGWRSNLAVVGFFTVLAVVFTWPVARELDAKIAGQPGDNLQFVWLIDWYKRALFELGRSPLFDPWLNFPDGWALSSIELPHTMIGLALPAVPLLGAIGAYNITSIASFLASALAPYAYVKRWTGSFLAALIAGTIFGFTPFRQSHFLIGHLNLLGTVWPGLYILSLIDLCMGKGRSLKGAWLLAGFLAATALTSQYYLSYDLLLSLPIIAAFWLRGNLRGRTAVGRGPSSPWGWGRQSLWWFLPSGRIWSSGSQAPSAHGRASMCAGTLPVQRTMSSRRRPVWCGGPGSPATSTGSNGSKGRSTWVRRERVWPPFHFCVDARQATTGPSWRWPALHSVALRSFSRLGQTCNGCRSRCSFRFPGSRWRGTRVPKQVSHCPEGFSSNTFRSTPRMRVPMRFGLFVILAVSLMAGLGAGHIQERLDSRTEGGRRGPPGDPGCCGFPPESGPNVRSPRVCS